MYVFFIRDFRTLLKCSLVASAFWFELAIFRMTFTVYEATFESSDAATYHYAGMTDMSLCARRRWHIKSRKGWLKDMVESTLRLRTWATCRTRAEALAQEAILAAELINRHGEAFARGGPWSLSYLRAEHRKEIEAVSHCQTAVAVRRAAKRGSDLLKHLQDEPYRGSYAVAKKKKLSLIHI